MKKLPTSLFWICAFFFCSVCLAHNYTQTEIKGLEDRVKELSEKSHMAKIVMEGACAIKSLVSAKQAMDNRIKRFEKQKPLYDNWQEACKNSSDPQIVQARTHLKQIRQQVRELYPDETQQLQSARANLTHSSIYKTNSPGDQKERYMAITEYSQAGARMLNVSPELVAKEQKAFMNLHGMTGICRTSEDPKVVKAYESWHNSKTECEKKQEAYWSSRMQALSAREEYNTARSKSPMLIAVKGETTQKKDSASGSTQ